MKTSVTLLTLPVSTNSLYRTSGTARFLTARGKSNKETMAWEAREQFQGAPLTGPLEAKIALYWPTKRNHDVDNIKALLDAMKGILWEDDGQIISLHVTKAYDKKNPRVELTTYPHINIEM